MKFSYTDFGGGLEATGACGRRVNWMALQNCGSFCSAVQLAPPLGETT